MALRSNNKTVYVREVRHAELGKYRYIKGADPSVVAQMAQAQVRQWDEQWRKKQEAEQRLKEKLCERQQALQEREDQKRERLAIQDAAKKESQRAKEAAAMEKEIAKERRENRRQEAELRTSEATGLLDELRSILLHTLSTNDAIDWDTLKSKEKFTEPKPNLVLPDQPKKIALPSAPKDRKNPPPPSPLQRPKEPTYFPLPVPPAPVDVPAEPTKDDARYQPVFGLIDKFSESRRHARVVEAAALFDEEHQQWEVDCNRARQQFRINVGFWKKEYDRVKAENEKAVSAWRLEVDRVLELESEQMSIWRQTIAQVDKEKAAKRSAWEAKCVAVKQENEQLLDKWNVECDRVRSETHPALLAEWAARKSDFYAQRAATNIDIDRQREKYLAGDAGAVTDYCEMVLSNSQYPDYFPREWDIDFQEDAKTLVIDYALPAPDALPSLKEIQYLQSKDDFKEIYLTTKEQESLYDSLMYQIAIRTIHELFEADVANALSAIVFNGLVTALVKSTGRDTRACILSVQAQKDEFMAFDLGRVDPKACFKSMKGIAASQLAGLAPVPPVLMIDKRDRRFVDGYGVVDGIDAGSNLATMHWEDFENLIREIFEREFSSSGGEVRVTQASRDGGVDAVVFDPDPIRGGKIVIQAKRYSNTVGVSAVRDLYGTLMNEGALKGILVTTANYGPDAYEFAKGKPLTLLNGGNLLHLLEKHGHHARINLAEARLMNLQP